MPVPIGLLAPPNEPVAGGVLPIAGRPEPIGVLLPIAGRPLPIGALAGGGVLVTGGRPLPIAGGEEGGGVLIAGGRPLPIVRPLPLPKELLEWLWCIAPAPI